MQRDKEKERHRLFLPPLSGSAVVYLVRTGGALLHHSLGWGSGICVYVCVCGLFQETSTYVCVCVCNLNVLYIMGGEEGEDSDGTGDRET